MRSALGESAGFARGSRPTVCPSRVKIRSSSPPASASRASMGTSRRQSEDHSSEITRIRAGPWGWAASHRIAAVWASLSRARSYHARSGPLKSWRCGPSHQPASRARFSGVPMKSRYCAMVMPRAKRSGVTRPLVSTATAVISHGRP